MDLKLTSHIEDYLEAIIMLHKKKRVVRVRDISRKMGLSMPSVCAAIKVLSQKGLVNHEKYGYIELTRQGENLGERIYDSHKILIKFLKEILNTDSRTAENDACKIEHAISGNTVRRLIAFVKFVENCPHPEGADWLNSFNYFYKYGKRPKVGKGKKTKEKSY
ncbi:MAG: metal-dependent transcriptional regulator [Elusimicrobiota bacterium]|nr:metal-dependent transcriptional regulator [Elusimicrobiota bacterium]MDH5662649.1 metal-dependent transcriptional regulator [Elusimicrobiota bacterium]